MWCKSFRNEITFIPSIAAVERLIYRDTLHPRNLLQSNLFADYTIEIRIGWFCKTKLRATKSLRDIFLPSTVSRYLKGSRSTDTTSWYLNWFLKIAKTHTPSGCAPSGCSPLCEWIICNRVIKIYRRTQCHEIDCAASWRKEKDFNLELKLRVAIRLRIDF